MSIHLPPNPQKAGFIRQVAEDYSDLVKAIIVRAFDLGANYQWKRRELKYLDTIISNYSFNQIWSVYFVYQMPPVMRKSLGYKLPPSPNALFRRFGEVAAIADKAYGRFNVKS